MWFSECRQSVWEILLGKFMKRTQPAMDRDKCENKLQVSQKTRNYWKAVRLPAFQKQSSMLHLADHHTYWRTIHSSSLTHSLHSGPAILHLLTTRSTVNIAACHHPFIAICCDKLIIRPVAIITVPVNCNTYAMNNSQSRQSRRRRPYLLH